MVKKKEMVEIEHEYCDICGERSGHSGCLFCERDFCPRHSDDMLEEYKVSFWEKREYPYDKDGKREWKEYKNYAMKWVKVCKECINEKKDEEFIKTLQIYNECIEKFSSDEYMNIMRNAPRAGN